MSKAAAPASTALSDAELPEEIDATDALLELFAESAREPEPVPVVVPARIHGVVVGRLLSLDGGPLVAWAGAPAGARARAFAPLDAGRVGAEVALVFEEGDPARPIVMGPMESLPAPAPLPRGDAAQPGAGDGVRLEALADGRRVVLEAEHELVLACGKASITLTRAGKILIRGAYVSSDASGTHRIRGATVEIN